MRLPSLRSAIKKSISVRTDVQASKDAELLLLLGGQAAVRKMVRKGAVEVAVECMAGQHCFDVREIVQKEFYVL